MTADLGIAVNGLRLITNPGWPFPSSRHIRLRIGAIAAAALRRFACTISPTLGQCTGFSALQLVQFTPSQIQSDFAEWAVDPEPVDSSGRHFLDRPSRCTQTFSMSFMRSVMR
jgi:hypothetical protein